MSWTSILKVNLKDRTDKDREGDDRKYPTTLTPEQIAAREKPTSSSVLDWREDKKQKPKTGKQSINKYALKLRDILSKYGDKGVVDKDIISEIEQSTILFRRTQLPNIFHVFSVVGSENIDKLRSETDPDVKPLQKRLAANYGGKTGYDIVEEIYDSLPETKGSRMSPKLREDLMREFTTPKSGLPRIIKDMETLSEFSFEGKKGTDALVELKDYVEEIEKVVQDGEETLPTDRIEDYRKKKDEIQQKQVELQYKVAELLREIRPRDTLKFIQFIDDMAEKDVISGETRPRPVKVEGKDRQMKVPREFTELRNSARKYGYNIKPKEARMILLIGKTRIKLQEAKDKLSDELKELGEDIKGVSGGQELSLSQFKEYGEALVENKKILDDFTLMIENNLDTLEERLTEMEAKGMNFLKANAEKYLPVLKNYIDIAEELNLYVDQDAMEFVEILDKLLSTTRSIDFDPSSAEEGRTYTF